MSDHAYSGSAMRPKDEDIGVRVGLVEPDGYVPPSIGIPDYHQLPSTLAAPKPAAPPDRRKTPRLATVYPAYYKQVPDVTHLDVYGVCQMFNITDQAIGHSLKKLLLTGVRTGGKPVEKDIKEARDTLNRWLELHNVE